MNIRIIIRRKALFIILISTCLLLCGCRSSSTGSEELPSGKAISPTITITQSDAISPTGEILPNNTGTPSGAIVPSDAGDLTGADLTTDNTSPTEAALSPKGDVIALEYKKDIDENDIMDSIQIMEREDGSEYVNVFFNGALIYQQEWKQLRLMAVDAYEYHDFDQDGENEIFINIYPNVNSRPLAEILTLKQTDGQWKPMEMPLNELGNNCFPITITRGAKEFDFVISCEYTDQKITFDASPFYKEDSTLLNMRKEYRQNHYKKGDVVAYTSAWGIWEAKTGTYKGRDCIIAVQGMEAPHNNGLGKVVLYYAYEVKGDLVLLKMEYEK